MSSNEMSDVDLLRAENQRLQQENAALRLQLSQAQRGPSGPVLADKDCLKVDSSLDDMMRERGILVRELQAIEAELNRKRRELMTVEEELELESQGMHPPEFAMTASPHFREKLEKIRDFQKALIRDGEALRRIGLSATASRKLSDASISKHLLRAFNNECDHCVEKVSLANLDVSKRRIERSFEVLNHVAACVGGAIAERYKDLKIDELHLAYEYQRRRKQEREELKAARERQREQDRLEKQTKEARARIAKDRRHLLVEEKRLAQRLEGRLGSAEEADIRQKLTEVRSRVDELALEEKELDFRESLPKAGFVYIISNEGSFGAGIYKIGVTRRLDADERIAELSDASVPFAFDTHAKIFSTDAFDLEAKLHAHLDRYRVNRVNSWKEFFRLDIEEIEAVVRAHYDNTFDLVREAVAEEYRESEKLAAQAERRAQMGTTD